MKYEITMGGRKYTVEVEVKDAMPMDEFAVYQPAAPAAPAVEAAPVAAPAAAPAAAPVAIAQGTKVESPMPGNILKVNVSVGDQVSNGQLLVVLEAMKMENEILAPKAGKVLQVLVSKGSTVDSGAVLVVLG